MNDDIEKRLDKVLRETLGLDSVCENLSQKNCDAWDSVNHLNLILALEAEFGIEFSPEEIAGAQSRAAVLATLTQKI